MRPALLPLYAKVDIQAESDVFLIDQLYTTMERALEDQVAKIDKVRDVCLQLMQLDVELEKGDKPRQTEEHSSAASNNKNLDVQFREVRDGTVLIVRGGLDNINSLCIPDENKDQNLKKLVAIEFRDNSLDNLDEIVAFFKEQAHQILAIDLSGNRKEFSAQELLAAFPNAELINGELTEAYSDWAFCYLAGKHSTSEISHLPLNECNIQRWKRDEFAKLVNCVELNVRSSIINKEALEVLRQLPKLRSLFTSWKYQSMFYAENGELPVPQLKKVNRKFTNLPTVPEENHLVAAFVKDNLWKFAETYTLQHLTYDPVWYLMDVVGLSIDNGHRLANFQIAPFYYIEKQEAYTLMWPVRNVQAGERITRDYSYGASDVMRTLFNQIWHPEVPLPDASKTSGATGGEFVNPKKKTAFDVKPEAIVVDPKKKTYRVCCDSKLVRDAVLTPHPKGKSPARPANYTLVGSFSEADILWIVHDHYTNPMEELPRGQYINQYQYEHNLTSKPYFSFNSQEKPWGIQSYFMGSEEHAYKCVKEFKRREAAGEHNIWIVKPSNLTRSAGIVVTDNLACILKWMNTPGDIVASIYLEKPALFKKHKFDLRYIVLLDSIHPEVKVYTYDRFKARIAPEEFALNDLDNFQKHFTVQQYHGGSGSTVACTEFVREWNKEHTDMPFDQLQKKINGAIRDMFVTVQDKLSDDNHAASPHCKALYGVDIMIDNSNGDYQPKILECNFSPDASFFQNMEDRNFFREVFDFLFTGQKADSIVEL